MFISVFGWRGEILGVKPQRVLTGVHHLKTLTVELKVLIILSEQLQS